MQRLENPFPIFLNTAGEPLDGGYVYLGEAGKDPENFPVATWMDQGLSVPIDQPLHTLGGIVVDGQNTTFVYVAESDYSIRVRDINGEEVIYLTSVALAAPSYQPLDSDLTAIAALSTTAFGRGLLTLANQAALQAAVGLPAALPLIGGTVTGNIIRSGAGGHGYSGDATYPSVRFFFPTVGDADPTSQAGDIAFWLAAP